MAEVEVIEVISGEDVVEVIETPDAEVYEIATGEPGLPGGNGEDGREVELDATETHVVWRYAGDADWIELVALDDLQGEDGVPIELDVTDTHIRWRYVGSVMWTQLIALTELTGPPGEPGPSGMVVYPNLAALDVVNTGEVGTLHLDNAGAAFFPYLQTIFGAGPADIVVTTSANAFPALPTYRLLTQIVAGLSNDDLDPVTIVRTSYYDTALTDPPFWQPWDIVEVESLPANDDAEYRFIYARNSNHGVTLGTSQNFAGTVMMRNGAGQSQVQAPSVAADIANKAYVDLRAPLASPAFTGNPTAPTPATADNDTSVATTAFVKAQGYAPLASPALTGNPTAPTPAPGDNDTTIATTAFVSAALEASPGMVIYPNMAALDAVRVTEVGILHVDNVSTAFPTLAADLTRGGMWAGTGPADVVVTTNVIDYAAINAPHAYDQAVSISQTFTALHPQTPTGVSVLVSRSAIYEPVGGTLAQAWTAWKQQWVLADPTTITNGSLLAAVGGGTYGVYWGSVIPENAAIPNTLMGRGADGNTQVATPVLPSHAATKAYVDLRAPLASPVFTGNPTAPTPATADNDTSVATTAFVKAQGYAPLASPALTGNPTAPTPSLGDQDTSIATTAFVKVALDALVNAAPGTLDTLAEIATALGNDPAFATTITGLLAAKAPLASPALTGNPTAPTPATADNDTSIATTAFVKAQGYVPISGALENVDGDNTATVYTAAAGGYANAGLSVYGTTDFVELAGYLLPGDPYAHMVADDGTASVTIKATPTHASVETGPGGTPFLATAPEDIATKAYVDSVGGGGGGGSDLAIAAGSAMNPHTSPSATRNASLPKNFYQTATEPTTWLDGDEWIMT